jgi:hypothetical protein
MGLALGVTSGTCHNTHMDEIEHQDLWAAEQRRRGMLALLDVQPLVARISPPGARASQPLTAPLVEVAFPEADRITPALNVAQGQSKQPAGAEISVSARSAQGESATAAGSSAPRKTQREITSGEVSTEAAERESLATGSEAVAFQLLIVEAGAWLWLEQLDDNLIRREQLQLVEGMARAITQGTVNLRHHQFDWPLSNHAHLPRDAESAKQSVAGQLRRLARERQALGLILMGSSCEEWVSVPPALTRLNIPSTLSMLEKPTLKRTAWQVLKPYSPQP